MGNALLTHGMTRGIMVDVAGTIAATYATTIVTPGTKDTDTLTLLAGVVYPMKLIGIGSATATGIHALR